MYPKILYCVLFLSIIKPGICLTDSNWEMILPPAPTSNQLVSLSFTDTNTGWAVGEYGTILKTIDAGEHWQLIPIPWSNYLLDVCFISASIGYVVGKDGFIVKSSDGGVTWLRQRVPFNNDLHRVQFDADNNGLIVGEKGLIVVTKDGGMNWTPVVSNTRENLNAISFINDTTICLVGDNKTILISMDKGQTWQLVKKISWRYSQKDLIDFNDVFFLNDKLGWIGGIIHDYREAGFILKSINHGLSWNESRIQDFEYSDFTGHASGNGRFPAGIQQIRFFDNDNGICLTGCAYSHSSNAYFCNIPLQSKNTGQTWLSQVHGIHESYNQPGRFAYLSSSKIVNTSFGGEFRTSTNGGAIWNYTNRHKRNFIFLLVGNKGQLLGFQLTWDKEAQKSIYLWSFSNDFGQNWESFLPSFYDKNGIQINNNTFFFPRLSNNKDETLLVIIDSSITPSGDIYESKDFGRSWYWVCDQIKANFRFHFFSPDTLFEYYLEKLKISSNEYKAMLRFSYSFDGGKTVSTDRFVTIWNEIIPYKMGDPRKFVSKSYFFNGHTGFLVGSEGNIIKTTDTGRSWENIPSGVVEDLWDITFVNRQTGFVVGDFGRILKTEDGGQTWRKTDSGTQENVYSIGFKNETEGWAGTETGLRYTTDGGETWQGVPLRYFHGPIREIEFDKDGTGYAYTHKFYPNEDKDSRPGGYILLLVLKEGGVVVENAPVSLPHQFSLSQNYPNPFNSTTHIRFSLPETEKISLKIFNIRGQLVRTLLDETCKSGEHAVVWNGTTDSGQLTASGIYIYRLTRNGEVRVRKLLLLK